MGKKRRGLRTKLGRIHKATHLLDETLGHIHSQKKDSLATRAALRFVKFMFTPYIGVNKLCLMGQILVAAYFKK